MEKRTRGQRRWGLETLFPLIDSNGVTVIIDRRSIADRRLGNTTLEERLTLFAEMPGPAPETGQDHRDQPPPTGRSRSP